MTVAASLAGFLPDKALAKIIGTVYRRVEPELGQLDAICGRGGVMIDVGAWYGPWSQRLARRADRLLAIEPTSRYRLLSAILPANAEVVHAAASDRSGTGDLWITGSGDGAEGLSSINRRDVHSHSLRVPLIRIDDLDVSGVRFIKIDVEGHEQAVLRGAAATVRRDRPRLLIEVETRMLQVQPLLDMLAAWGYGGWVLESGHWRPLAGFDLAGRQEAALRVAQAGMLRRMIWPYPRYINSVLFLPAEAAKP